MAQRAKSVRFEAGDLEIRSAEDEKAKRKKLRS
jgi:hypothetical protein